MLTRFIAAIALMVGAANADSYRIANYAWTDMTVHHCYNDGLNNGKGTVHVQAGQQININSKHACDGFTWVNVHNLKWLKIKHFNDNRARTIEIHGTAFGVWEKYLIEPNSTARATTTVTRNTAGGGNTQSPGVVYNSSIHGITLWRDDTPGVPKW